MKVIVLKSFEKDIERVSNKKLASQLLRIISSIEEAENIEEIPNTKKMKGGGSFYRIRIGQYRLGLSKQSNSVTLIRFMHRKEVYNYFP